jgi:hypothetical protein
MKGVHPLVRYLIVCDDIRTGPDNPQRVSLVGLCSAIRSLADPPFPVCHEELCVFVQLTGCRGPGQGRIEIVHADSGRMDYRSPTWPLPLPSDPLEVVGLPFRLRNCVFREAGLYWVQFWYDEQCLAQQPLLLR